MARRLGCRASSLSKWRRLLSPSVALAWREFDRASTLPSRVTPAAPILFFGDLNAYRTSPVRVLTVGLNPSLHEFPVDEPFRRFPLACGHRAQDPGRYLDSIGGQASNPIDTRLPARGPVGLDRARWRDSGRVNGGRGARPGRDRGLRGWENFRGAWARRSVLAVLHDWTDRHPRS